MKITKIQISNYRSCHTTEFSPHDNLSVLIGPNGSGKTNILTAMLLLKQLATESHSPHDALHTAKCTLKVWFRVNEKRAICTFGINTYADDSNNDVIVHSTQRSYLRDFTKTSKRYDAPFSILRDMHRYTVDVPQHLRSQMRQLLFRKRALRHELPEAGINALTEIANQLSQMRYYSASQFTNPAMCPVSFEIEQEGGRSRGFRLQGHAKFLFDLYREYKTKTGRYHEFFGIIGPAGIGLVDDIWFKRIPTSSIDYTVRSGGRVRKRKRQKSLIIPQFKVGRHELSPNQLSEGTFKTITLLFYVITETSSLLLVEEPEVCVHHGLLSSIIELIKIYSRDKQIILSTHSDFVLDQVPPESVHSIVNNPDVGTTVRCITKAMSRQELTALRCYLDTEGNLGEYWRHGALEV